MKKNRTWKGILLVILLLSIGFAAVTTTLFLNGTFTFGSNQDNFENNLTFTAAKLEYSDTNKATKEHGVGGVTMITNDGKKIEFTVDTLTDINENATLTYEISNNGQYDARLGEVACTVKTNITAENAEGTDVTNDVLAGAKDGNGKYKEYVKLDKSLTNDVVVPAYTGKKSGNTLKFTMVKSYAETEPKEYKVSCEIVAQAEAADATAGA